MSGQSLKTTVRRASPMVNVIDIEGEVNSLSETGLTEAYARAVADGTRSILFNFSKMTYLNSLGIGMLVVLLIRGQREAKNIGGFGLSEHYRKIFELTRLDNVIPIYPTEAVALAACEPFDLPEREN